MSHRCRRPPRCQLIWRMDVFLVDAVIVARQRFGAQCVRQGLDNRAPTAHRDGACGSAHYWGRWFRAWGMA